MKTLDEVIESITKQSGLEIRNIRKADKDRFWVDRETYNDALHYLKEYKTLQYGYIKAIADLEDNPALTWTELQGMEGKPVWVERNNDKEWMLNLGTINGLDDVERMSLRSLGHWHFFTEQEMEDGIWQAYRKER